MKKRKKKLPKGWARISMQVNQQKFSAEGPQAEVSAKFQKWLDEVFKPIQQVKQLATNLLESAP